MDLLDNQNIKPESDLPVSSNTAYKEHRSLLQNLGYHFVDFIQTLVVFGAIFSVLYLFVAQPHRVSGNSMFPTFHNGDYILTDKLSYRLGNPKKGDVIVLKNPQNEAQDFIKRIMAIPGDTIKIEAGRVYVNGQILDEAYLKDDVYTNQGNFMKEGQTISVSSNQYIAIGDNRQHSSDSRDWGYVATNKIIGKVFFRYWPPQAIGLYKDPIY